MYVDVRDREKMLKLRDAQGVAIFEGA